MMQVPDLQCLGLMNNEGIVTRRVRTDLNVGVQFWLVARSLEMLYDEITNSAPN